MDPITVWVGLFSAIASATITASIPAFRSRWERRHVVADDERLAFEERPVLRKRIMEQEDLIADLRLEVLMRDKQLRRLPTYLIERELAELNGLARFFDHFHDCIAAFTSDESGTCIYVNAAFCRKLGRVAADFLGQSWRQWVHPEDVARTKHEEAATAFRDVIDYDNRWLHSDGEYRLMIWNCRRHSKEGFTLCHIEIEALPFVA